MNQPPPAINKTIAVIALHHNDYKDHIKHRILSDTKFVEATSTQDIPVPAGHCFDFYEITALGQDNPHYRLLKDQIITRMKPRTY